MANAVVNVLRGLGTDDTLNTRDGTATVDHVECGNGTDRFRTDASDSPVACEIAF